MINPVVKKHFLKFGLSEKALQGLSDSVTGSLSENATDEEITAKCQELEPFAKTFQSEIDTRVNTALKKTNRGRVMMILNLKRKNHERILF